MHVYIRAYCYRCRMGRRWYRDAWWQANVRAKHRCRWEWEYWIGCDGFRLHSRTALVSWDGAIQSAHRAWKRLAALGCVRP